MTLIESIISQAASIVNDCMYFGFDILIRFGMKLSINILQIIKKQGKNRLQLLILDTVVTLFCQNDALIEPNLLNLEVRLLIYIIKKQNHMYYYYYPMVPYPIEGPVKVEEAPIKIEQAQAVSQNVVYKQQCIDDQYIYEKPCCQSPLNIILTMQDLRKIGYQVNKKVWTQQEDRLLLNYKEQKKLNWNQISKKLIERNPKMCYSRYRRLKNSTKILWRKKDDDKLLKLINELGQDWTNIITHFKRRNIRQLKEHYNNYLRPGIIERQWDLQDDLRLIALLNKYGNNWKLIEANFIERSINQIKNRYYGRIKKLNDIKLTELTIKS